VSRRLVIVESSAKARTLARLLGPELAVRCAPRPVRELPTGRLGVDVSRGFAAEWEVPPSRRAALRELRAAVAVAATVYLAADPDAEGEALCAHLLEEVTGHGAQTRARFRRILLPELTSRGVERALATARGIEPLRVEAHEARVILDRLAVELLAPLVPKGLRPTSPAGRLTAAALGVVCGREREIEAFARAPSWSLRARLDAGRPPLFTARLRPAVARGLPPPRATEADRLREATFVVRAVRRPERLEPPAPAFVTSTLIQEAFRRLRLPAERTMALAQRLYEGVLLGSEGPVGLITFPRTDASPAKAPGAAEDGSPDDLEAIRPTDLGRTPGALVGLGRDARALYALVFERFVSSRMAPAVHEETLVEVEARGPEPPLVFEARGSVLRRPGFRAPDEASRAEPQLPPLDTGDLLRLVEIEVGASASDPPARFDEASFVDALERLDLGRAASFAAILATLREAGLVESRSRRIQPSRLGLEVERRLSARFPALCSAAAAAEMEARLDAVGQGRDSRLGCAVSFWKTHAQALSSTRGARQAGGGPRAPAPPPGRGGAGGKSRAGPGACPRCGHPLAPRHGRFGVFLGCSRYPACRHVEKNEAKAAGLACPRCHEGAVVERDGPEGRRFFGCSRYPACRFTSQHRPLAEACPECGSAYLLVRRTRGGVEVVFCPGEGCRHRRRV
jgi:DNA topoisomerase-1